MSPEGMTPPAEQQCNGGFELPLKMSEELLYALREFVDAYGYEIVKRDPGPQ